MYYAYITTIRELRKHSNADKLQCATIFGNNVIVDMSYNVGDRVVYFPSDGQLNKEFAEENNLVRRKDENGKEVGGYLDPNKRNIKAINLRGEKSDGLVLPISVLSKYTNIDELKDGLPINILNGHEICRKYIPVTNHRNHTTSYGQPKKKNEKNKYPYFEQHIDTEQLAYNQNAFKIGDTIYLTQKLHGTSFRVANTLAIISHKRGFIRKLLRMPAKVTQRYMVVSGSRRVTLGNNFDDGYYGNNIFRKTVHDFFAERLPKGFEVFGEIVGWVDENTPIMPKCNNSKVKDKAFTRMYGSETIFTYGCEPGKSDFYVYRITVTTEDGLIIELPTEEVQRYCKLWGCKFVPVLDKFIYNTWDDLNERCSKFLDIPEPLANGSHVTEGVVVRIDNRAKFTAYKTKSYAFKVLEGIIKETSDSPDMEEAEELISEKTGSVV